MNRLTQKQGERHATVCGANWLFYGDGLEEIITKLGKLEDIEEELGCPFEVVFKALNDGVYIEVEHLPDVIERPRLYCSDDFKCYCLELLYGEYVIKLSDYQKTWWLKGEK